MNQTCDFSSQNLCEISKRNSNIMTDKQTIEFYKDFQSKFPLAWKQIFGEGDLEENDENNKIGNFLKENDKDFVISNMVITELKKSGIDAFLGRTIQEKGTLYKPMIVNIREFNSTVTYFLVNDEDKQVWQKLSYEEMPEFSKAKHFPGYESLEMANNTLISKAFGVLNSRLYGQ